MKKDRIINILMLASRVVLGFVFIFSGFVKGVDPMGSAFKFSDYFNAFNLGFLEPLAIILAFVLAAAEFLIGIALLFSFRFRIGAWAITVFMGFFTVLTFILALTNPVTDCGCFGDAVILTNWQTFLKNLILLPFVFIVFYYRHVQVESWSLYFSWGGLLVFGILFLILETNAVRHLPVMDFRPYSVGTYIPDKMNIPEGAPQDEYQSILYYEKNGKTQEFTEDNFPWEDTSWTFVDTDHKLIRKGFEPPIHDFTIVDEYGIDLVNDILIDDGYSFLLIGVHFEKADPEALAYADELASWCIASGHSFYCLSASLEEDILQVREDLDLGFTVHPTDEIALKTIVRSNPGLLLVKEGTIMGKWHYNDFPALDEIQDGLMAYTMSQNRKALEKRSLGIFIALFLALSVFIQFNPFGKSNN